MMMTKKEFLRVLAERAGIRINDVTLRNLVRELQMMLYCEDVCSREFSYARESCMHHCIYFFKHVKR